MADIVQHVLHNDLFYAVGANLLFSLEGPAKLWQPVKQPPSSSQLDVATITVTQAVPMSNPTTITVTSSTTVISLTTLTEEAFETVSATHPAPETVAITSYVPHTVRDTVTKQVTWNSTFTERHWLTSWTHYPTPDSSPEPTSDLIPDLTKASAGPLTTLRELWAALPVSWSRARVIWTWVLWTPSTLGMGMIIGLSLGYWWNTNEQPAVKEEQRAALVKEKRQHLATKETLKKFRDELGKPFGEQRRQLAQQELFIRANGTLETLFGFSVLVDEDKDTFSQRVRMKQAEIVAKTEEYAQLMETNEKHASTINTLVQALEDRQERIKDLITKQYVPGVHRSFDNDMDVLRNERDRYRAATNISSADEAAKTRENRIATLESEIIALRPYAEEGEHLLQRLKAAQGENKKLQAQLTTQSRRHNKEIRELKTILTLKETHSKSTSHVSSENNADTSEVQTNNDQLGRSVIEVVNDRKQLQESLDASVAEQAKMAKQLEKQKMELDDQRTKDKRKCEDEKRSLDDEIIELRVKLTIFEKAQQNSPSGHINNTDTQHKVETLPNEAIHSARIATLERELNELSAYKTRLEQDAQAKESNEKDMSNHIVILNKSLGVRDANEQNLLNQINFLANERDTAKIETSAIKKQLEEVTASNGGGSWVSQADVDAYSAPMTQKDEHIRELLATRNQEIDSRDQKIIALESQAKAGTQAIDGLKQQIAALQSQAETGNQEVFNLREQLVEQANTINNQKELLAAVDKKKLDAGRIDVAGKDTEIRQLNHKINRLEDQAKENARRRKTVIDERTADMQQQIDELKNSQEAEAVARLQHELDEKKEALTEFSENGPPAGYKKLLQQKKDQIRAKEKDIAQLKREKYKLWYDGKKLGKGDWNNHIYKSAEWDFDEDLLTGNESQLREKLSSFIVKVKQLETEIEKLDTEKKNMELKIEDLELFGGSD